MEGLTPARGVAGFHQGGPFGGPGLATNSIIFTNSIFIGLRGGQINDPFVRKILFSSIPPSNFPLSWS